MKALESSTSISFKNILFLTDLTEASRAAFSYALAFARHYQARLYLAHAVTPYLPTELEAPVMPDILVQIAETKRQELLSLMKDTRINFVPLVTQEPVESAVPRWINEHGIDLIIMGTHGRVGVQRLFLGSTAEMIIRTATCPVLTVGPNVSVPKTEELAIEKVLFATDLSRPSESAAVYALSFARDRQGKVTLLHILPETPRRHSDIARLRAFALDELGKMVPRDSSRLQEPTLAVKSGSPADTIIEYARQNRPDLLVLGLPRDKKFSTHFRAGVTYKVISSAPVAVLTIRDLAAPVPVAGCALDLEDEAEVLKMATT